MKSHTDEIYQFEKLYYDHHGEYCLHGNISVSIEIKSGVQYLIDGQHRLSAYRALQRDHPDRSITLSIDYYECEGMEAVEQTYKLVNTNMINPITQLSVDEYRIINDTVKWLQTNFREYVKSTMVPHKPCFNPETIRNSMIEKQVVKRLDIKTSQQLIDLVIGLNTFYSRVDPSTYRKLGVRDISKYLQKIAAMSNGFYLGIYRTEWIDVLIDCPPSKYTQIDHLMEGYRVPISKVLRQAVWNSKSLEGQCYCCDEKITFDTFECGHITAVSKGGKTTLDNLRPVCRRCNSDMRTNNMDEYKRSIQAGIKGGD
jgi:hypothetical protein